MSRVMCHVSCAMLDRDTWHRDAFKYVPNGGFLTLTEQLFQWNPQTRKHVLSVKDIVFSQQARRSVRSINCGAPGLTRQDPDKTRARFEKIANFLVDLN